MRIVSALILTALFWCGTRAIAHDAGGKPHDEPAGPSTGDGTGIVIESTDGANPWSHLALRNDPRAFQFAIVTDRTGGSRPGIFEDAVRKLNLLQPEFVMSVGDLIQGYTEDEGEIRAEWDEFQGFIKGLEMPFFYVPGNHDYTNRIMAEIWRERFGRDHYAFVYRDVLFLCLNSQDPEMHHIGQEQAEWVKKTLAAHPDVRWTLVFLHSPLWEESYSEDRGWLPVEQALQGRNYTVFAGHFHTYMKRMRKDQRYYILATTGGGSDLRGPSYGQFDHVAWVTMTDAGPLVANLMLQGIWDDEIRTPEIRDLVEKAEAGGIVTGRSVWCDAGEGVENARTELLLTNPLDVPVELTFTLSPGEGVSVRNRQHLPLTDDGRYRVVLQPRAVKALDLELGVPRPQVHQATPAVAVASEAKFQKDGMVPVTLRGRTTLAVVPRLRLAQLPKPATVDGDAGDWPQDQLFNVTKPGELQRNADSWTGADDASFRWATAIAGDVLYAVVAVRDDEVQAEKEKPPWFQDGIELRIDGRPERVRNVRTQSEKEEEIMLIAMSPGTSAQEPWIHEPEKLPEGTRAVCVRGEGGYVMEVAVPLAGLTARYGEEWKKDGLRFNVAVNDRDGREQVQFWWQPDWRRSGHIPNSGTLFLPGEP